MNKFTNPLDNIKVASPCRADWDAMVGNEKKRFCGECQLNVYNLSGMSRREAEQLLIDSEGRVCVRFYKRADGTVLTQDCPVGWQMIKQRASKTAAAFASLFFGVLSALGITAFFNQSSSGQLTKEIAYQSTPKPKATPKNMPEMPTMGVPVMPTPTPKTTPKPKETPEEVTMGEIYVPTPTPKPKKDMKVLIGRVVNADN